MTLALNFRRTVALFSLLLLPWMAGAQAPNPDFDTVTAKLDKGGTFYLYAELEDVLLEAIRGVESVFTQSGDSGAAKLPLIARSIVKSLGLDSVSDLGISVLPLDAKNNRMKIYLHLKQPGGIFALRGKAPYELESLGYIPADVVYASAQNVSFDKLMDVMRQVATQVAGAQGEAQMLATFEKAKRKGYDIPKIIESLGDEWAVYLSFNSDKLVELDMGGEKLRVPRPDGVMMVKVKDSTLYDTLTSQMEKQGGKLSAVAVGEGIEARAISVPDNPFGFAPVIARSDGWLFFASHADELKRALATADSKQNVRTSPDYLRLAGEMPTQINGVTFVSPRLSRELASVFEKIEERASRRQAVPLFLLRQVVPAAADSAGRVTVRVNEPQGILWVSQGDVHVGRTLQMLATSAGAPVLAAIAVPNFLEAGVRSKVSRVKSDMRSMATALESYYVDNNQYPEWTEDPEVSARKATEGKVVPSFRMRGGEYQGAVLTTPVAYITQLMPDPFSADAKQTFGYYAPKTEQGATTGWILFSPGPDKKFDLDWKVYDPSKPQPSPELLLFSYDPTNGTVSSGDVFRVKQ